MSSGTQPETLEQAAERNRRLETLDKLFWLASRDIIFFGSYNTAIGKWDEHWHPAVNVNDTFYYASADAEDLKEEEIDGLIDVVKKFSHDGVTAWAARRRGMEPLPQLQTDKYREAVTYLALRADAPADNGANR
jgi:hypothetical protein